ncbi:MAG: hypothetical protein GY802_07365 [Gammaproteobacteria bacterium]|nr:hypothetical protein [Gammaproteobacteria bacterium]
MSNAEQGIAQIQIEAARTEQGKADALQINQRRSIAYLDDRIFLYLGAIAFLGLLVVWATSTSTLMLYGSLGLAILLTILWGVARIKRINRRNEERARQVQTMQSESPD